MTLTATSKHIPFKIKTRPSTNQTTTSKFKFKVKVKKPLKTQYQLFVELCNKHSLPYFQFYDEDSWCGPVTKVVQDDFERILDVFEAAQDSLKTIILNGYGFVIIKPVQQLDDLNIQYPTSHFDACKMTHDPLEPYNTDMDVDDDDQYSAETESESESENIIVEEEFIAEEWKYNNTLYLLDTSTNYVYSPSTLEFVGKKTSDFSIDYDAKEC
tara:strand:+ start:1619 stop:2257 length:639 start_codon:yes stop_codon:yes gene_type:complete